LARHDKAPQQIDKGEGCRHRMEGAEQAQAYRGGKVGTCANDNHRGRARRPNAFLALRGYALVDANCANIPLAIGADGKHRVDISSKSSFLARTMTASAEQKFAAIRQQLDLFGGAIVFTRGLGNGMNETMAVRSARKPEPPRRRDIDLVRRVVAGGRYENRPNRSRSALDCASEH
jgi:hypothetical protein